MKRWSRTITGTFALALASALWLQGNASTRAALEALRRDVEDLKAQIEVCNAGLVAIKGKLEDPRDLSTSLRSSSPDAPILQPSRIEELLRQQSNTTALVQRLIDTNPLTENPEHAAERAQESVATVERALADSEQHLETAEVSVTNLRTRFNVPADIAALDSVEEADPNMRDYLPFFRAKMDRETARRILENVRRRLAEVQADLRAAQERVEVTGKQ